MCSSDNEWWNISDELHQASSKIDVYGGCVGRIECSNKPWILPLAWVERTSRILARINGPYGFSLVRARILHIWSLYIFGLRIEKGIFHQTNDSLIRGILLDWTGRVKQQSDHVRAVGKREQMQFNSSPCLSGQQASFVFLFQWLKSSTMMINSSPAHWSRWSGKKEDAIRNKYKQKHMEMLTIENRNWNWGPD